MVSSSRYLSLTGSKFGLGQFVNMEEKDLGEKSGEKSRGRSRSPFTWWLSTMQDRSQSRQSYISSQPQMGEVQSQYYHKPEPAFCNGHIRKESTASDYSLPSIINGKELAEDARAHPLPAVESSGSPHGSRYVNFSRAFSPLQQSSLRSTSAPNILSQIVESSPRHSTVSKPPSVASTREAVSKRRSMMSAGEVTEEDASVPISHPPAALRPLQTAPSVPDHLLETYSAQNMVSRFSFTTETSLSLSTAERSRSHSVPSNSHLPASPRSGPCPHGKLCPPEDVPTLNSVRCASEKQPGGEIEELDDSPPGSMRDDSPNPQSMVYWESRPDLQPVRKLRKKGNVLRKKSIRRAEVASWVSN